MLFISNVKYQLMTRRSGVALFMLVSSLLTQDCLLGMHPAGLAAEIPLMTSSSGAVKGPAF